MQRSRNIANYRSLIGMTLDEAKHIYRNIRVVKEDNILLRITEDLRFDRLNVAIVNGTITELLGFS